MKRVTSSSIIFCTLFSIFLLLLNLIVARRARSGHELPTLSFLPISAISPRPLQMVGSLVGTFTEPIAPEYYHNNFPPSNSDENNVNKAPIAYGGIINCYENININGYEGKHVMEHIAVLFEHVIDMNKIITEKSRIRRHRMRVTNDHGKSGLTIPSYVSYDGQSIQKFKYNVTLGINYWIYLTVKNGNDDNLLKVHFIGLTKDNYRHFNIIQHTFYNINSDGDKQDNDTGNNNNNNNNNIVSLEVMPDATTAATATATTTGTPEKPANNLNSKNIIPNVDNILQNIIDHNNHVVPQHKSNEGNRKLKVMSFNVWNTNPPHWVYPNGNHERISRYNKRIELLVDVIRKADPDIIGFQEVRYDSNTNTNGGVDGSPASRFQLQHILNHLNKHLKNGETETYKYYVWQPSMLYFNPQSLAERVEEGAAIISKYPIVSTDYLLLPRFLDDNDDRQHQRVCLHAKILIPQHGLLDIFTTHLSLSEKARVSSVRAIWDFIQTNLTTIIANNDKGTATKSSAILLGDLNSEPQSYDMKYLSERMDDFWLINNDEPEPRSKDPTLRKNAFTFPSDDPKKRIDFIFGHNIDIKEAFNSIKLYGQDPSENTKNDPGHGMLDSDSPMWASDHRAIMLTLNL